MIPNPLNCHGVPDPNPLPFTKQHWEKWGHVCMKADEGGWFQQAYPGQTYAEAMGFPPPMLANSLEIPFRSLPQGQGLDIQAVAALKIRAKNASEELAMIHAIEACERERIIDVLHKSGFCALGANKIRALLEPEGYSSAP